ncbi:CobB/CobQ-like glutamine amidotransferase domain protein [Streptococcus constellatus subsp. pharyngis SK1060 = CCUG 46377]|uniref:CobB/CobQ-like glutamine amidotransferase domain protein n=1 Tax=Streptococcus constellatus subsp. pharyngis SK1060 = CCUG 46377 TaxID=1035184 RepID=F9P6S0_STRCV|nr:CobB/CobQ-like glutamine amidotransferase domain protein [Streptococcus constellatus subsp. pharyngis SK1060 = CCUG 46377]
MEEFINHDGVVLAICGGFQLLGQYYIEASGRRIEGLGIMGHYTLNQKITATSATLRFITKNSMRPTTALKITKDGPSSPMMKNHWAKSSMEMATIKKTAMRASTIRMSLAPTSTVPSCPAMRTWPTVW